MTDPASAQDASSPLLRSLDAGLGWLENAFNVLAAVTIFLVMIGTTVGIAARLLGAPIQGQLELSELSIAIFAFLGAAYAQRLGAHIRMELGVNRFAGRARFAVEALATLLALALVVVLIRYSWTFFLNAYEIGDSTPDSNIPTWPAKLLVPIAFTVWAARLTLEFVGFVRLALFPGATPIGVPPILTAAEEAAQEIEHMRDSHAPEAGEASR
ncbi:TRAP transporter small permease [Acuticoccus sp.]|uniref:TRAP transporter small permease n=1 Tax=Acuticoccus sp. TaxID=1904378 RepID=UPI003B5268EF